MWLRQDLKQKGKKAFKANYWASVVAALFATVGAGMTFFNSTSGQNEMQDAMDAVTADQMAAFFGTSEFYSLLMILMVGSLVIYILALLFLSPLTVGSSKFFINNRQQPANIRDILFTYNKSFYLKTVGKMFCRDMFLFLWTLLFIIPGIIKSYEYRMIPYILAENPEMTRKEVFEKSKAMMKDNKWKTFVLDVSFILWFLGSVFTLGLLNIFYTAPYICATNAELYIALKD